MMVWTALGVCAGLLAAPDANPNGINTSYTDIESVPLEDLLNMEVEVANKQATKVVDAPGVLTVVTRDDIQALGARDLLEVLHFVDGFSFGTDVESVIGLAFRGVWGHEGKILLMEDGQELNETLYGSTQFGFHYPLYNVERVEIIRGAGSVVYGGMAELAVINVVTRNADAIGTVGAQLQYGQASRDYTRRGLEVAYGHRFSPDLALSAAAAVGQGRLSDEQFVDLDGGTPYLGAGDNARQDPLHVNLAMDWKDLHLHFILDDFRTTDRYPYSDILDRAYNVNYLTALGDARHVWRINDQMTLTSRLNYRYMLPWNSTADTPDSYANLYYDKTAHRALASATWSYDILEGMNLLAGIQATVDVAQATLPADPNNWSSTNSPWNAHGDLNRAYQNYAAYAQFSSTNPYVNVTAGVRYELHSVYGSSFVPRLALTKSFAGFHFKLLGSIAFKAPTIENIHLAPGIKPERTYDFELELGYVLTETMYLGVNLFDITVQNPIVYEAVGNVETYSNYPRTGKRGLEAQWRYHGPLGFAAASYSFAIAAGKNEVPLYAVPQDLNALLGTPIHKVVLTLGARIGEHVSVGPSFIFMGTRYGTLTDANNIDRSDPKFLLNVFVAYRNLGIDGLDVGLGGYNLLGEHFTHIQPYNGGRAPLPALPREAMLRVSYALH